MATNLDIIKRALSDLNVISEVETPSAEQGAYCLSALNDMMQIWSEDDIDIGWFVQTSTTDTYPLPDWTRQGVAANLAITVAPRYGAASSPELVAKATNSYATMQRKSVVENLRPANMNHMPAGAASTITRSRILTDEPF